MKHLFWLSASVLMCALVLVSCDDDDDPGLALLNAEVTVSNTLQTAADPSLGGTGGVETPIEAIFGLPAGALITTATVTEGVEISGYLDGLYDIDLSNTTLQYRLVAPADHPVYSNFFRTLEANTFDRYYFRFNRNHGITAATSSNASASLRVLSPTEFVVEIGEGFSFNPGTVFEFTLN